MDTAFLFSFLNYLLAKIFRFFKKVLFWFKAREK